MIFARLAGLTLRSPRCTGLFQLGPPELPWAYRPTRWRRSISAGLGARASLRWRRCRATWRTASSLTPR